MMSQGVWPRSIRPIISGGNRRSDRLGGRRGRVRAGLVAAMALGVGFVGLIGYFAFRPKPVGPTTIGAGIPEPEPETLIKGTKGVKISLMDKRDPSRQTGELTFAGMDPLENEPHMVAVESPKAWLSTRNGWWVRVSAPAGKLYMPDRQRPPESGTLSGGVDVRAYKPLADGTRPAEDATATATFKVASVDFDTLLMQLRTAESWTLAMPELDATGDGLTWKYSEANEITEFAEVAGNLSVTYWPGAGRSESAGGGVGETRRVSAGEPIDAPEKITRASDTGIAAAETGLPAKPGGASSAGTLSRGATLSETLYHLALRDRVRVAQGEREIAGPSMVLWARLLDGALPAEALAPIRTFSREGAGGVSVVKPAAAPTGSGASSERQVAGASLATPASPAGGRGEGAKSGDVREAITLHSKGTATLRALRETPTRLEKNHLAIAMDGTAEIPVRVLDAVDGVVARAGHLEYLGTTRWFQMLGFDEGTIGGARRGAGEPAANGSRGPAEVRLVGRGTLEASHLEADLASGLVLVRGPGSLRSETEDRCVRWRNQADVSMLMVDGAMAAAAREIVLQGGVEAGDGGTMVSGEHVLVTFEPEIVTLAGEQAGPSELLTGRANLKRVVVQDRAMADAGAGGWVKAQKLVADFDGTVARSPEVSMLRALGGVEGGRGEGTRVWAEALNATLGVDAIGRSYVSEAVIDGGESEDGTVGVGLARFEDRGKGGHVGSDVRTRAQSPRMVVRPESEQVDLVGAGSWVEQAGTRLSGLDVRLDGLVNRAFCEGAGELTHRDAMQRADEEPMVRAVWSERFSYDDSTGLGECEGDVSMVKTPDAWSRDEAIAQRVELMFRRVQDGGEAAASAGGEGALAEVGGAARALVRARALGSRLDRLDGENARVSSRRTHRVASGELLEQITFLEGPELVMDDDRGTGWVKGAGRMLLVDERESRVPTGDGGITAPGDGRERDGTLEGRTLISWQGSGTVDRASGRVELVRGATITHQPNARGRAAAAGSAAAGAVGGREMVLEAERAVAFVVFGEAGGAGGSSSRRGTADRERGRLTSAFASGGTYLRYGTRELTAERTEYDAERGIVRAYAADTPGAVLTMFDQRTGTAQTARTVVWNLLTDAFEIDSPGALVTPR